MTNRNNILNTPNIILILLVMTGVFCSICTGDEVKVRVSQADKSRFPIIDVFVSVTDATGASITYLDAQDFRIDEDKNINLNKTVAGSGVSKGSLTVVLVIDRSGSMVDAIENVKEAAKTFISMLKTGDKAVVIGFNERVEILQSITSDSTLLRDSVDRIFVDGKTALYDATNIGVEQVKDLPGRRAVVVLTDGQDNESSNPLSEVIGFTERSNVTIYPIGLGSQVLRQELQTMAERTGGQALFAPSPTELKQLYEMIGTQIKNEYKITYTTPRSVQDGSRRTVIVDVSRPGLTGTAKGFYLAGGVVGAGSMPSGVGYGRPSLVLLLVPIIAALALIYIPRLHELIRYKLHP